MAHVPDFLKINSEEDATEYLLKVFNTPIIERYGKSAFELDSAAGLNDEPIERPIDDDDESEEGTLDGSINGLHYVEDQYTGRHFDRLEVLGRDVDKTGKNPYYVCRCNCGNVKSIAVNSLLSGVTKSCGCLKKESDKPNDLTGRKFGKLTVRCLDEERTAQTHRGYWICDCKCGGVKSVRSDALLGGKTTSCGCTLTESRHRPNTAIMKDLTDQRFGKLRAIRPDRTKDSRQGVYWICECECGNISSVRSADLVNKKTKSCGHCRDKIKYDLSGEYGVGYTTSGTRFLFDKEDYEKIAPYTWGTDAYGYIVAHLGTINGERKSVKMHRLVMGISDPNIHIDHIGHDMADNRKSQLRVATRNENMHNMQLSKSNTSGRTGVYYDKDRNKWRAAIRVNGNLKYLGLYDSFEEACKVRDAAEDFYFKEFKYKNNPPQTEAPSKPINPFDNLPRKLNSSNTSGHTGVSYDSSRQNWRAFMMIDGKQTSIGAYPTYEEACKAREEFEKKHKGS